VTDPTNTTPHHKAVISAAAAHRRGKMIPPVYFWAVFSLLGGEYGTYWLHCPKSFCRKIKRKNDRHPGACSRNEKNRMQEIKGGVFADG
jgi:hypothetical protein